MKRLCVGLAAFGMLVSAVAASATTWYLQEMACPVGGKVFTYSAMGSNSYWGSRPDGQPYSPTPVGHLPECPDNHLVVYREFTPDEVIRLGALIVSPEYTAMTEVEVQYYRSAWLEKALIGANEDHASMLLTASWQANDGSEQKARYQAEFAAAAAGLPARPDDAAGRMMQVRLANARRELGDFAGATAVLDALPLAKLGEGLPATEAEAEAEALEDEDRQNTWYFLDFVRKLRVVIARQDRSAEPIDMIGANNAGTRCFFEAEALSETDKALCQAADIQAEIEDNREYWEKAKANR